MSKVVAGFHHAIFPEGTFTIPKRYLKLGDKILSSGRDGITMLAHDKYSHKQVVIKKRKIPFSHPRCAKRLHRDFVWGQLTHHRNVIELLDAFSPQYSLVTFKEVYLVSEYFAYPLNYLIHHCEKVFQHSYGLQLISYFIYQILCGIKHLNKAGIIHKDLSTSSIMVNKSCQLKIIDFGNAKTDKEMAEIMSGYFSISYYKSPESILGIEEDNKDFSYRRKVDLWAVGCMIYEMIVGKPLFPGSNCLDQWTRITNLLGSPSEKFIKSLSEPIRIFLEKSPRIEHKTWIEVLMDVYFEKMSNIESQWSLKINAQTCRDLISKLLVIDPDTRISVEQALECHFVNWEHQPGEMEHDTNLKMRYDGHIEEMSLNENEWKTLLFGEVKQYERMNSSTRSTKIHECETCAKFKCECFECTKFDLGQILKNFETTNVAENDDILSEDGWTYMCGV